MLAVEVLGWVGSALPVYSVQRLPGPSLCQEYGVDVLLGSVGPDDPDGGEAFEHPSFVGSAGRDRGGVASVVEYSAPAGCAPVER